jgi:hypothetical protein
MAGVRLGKDSTPFVGIYHHVLSEACHCVFVSLYRTRNMWFCIARFGRKLCLPPGGSSGCPSMAQFAFDNSKSVRRMLRDTEPAPLKADRAKYISAHRPTGPPPAARGWQLRMRSAEAFVYLLADRAKRAVLMPTVVPPAVTRRYPYLL